MTRSRTKRTEKDTSQGRVPGTLGKHRAHPFRRLRRRGPDHGASTPTSLVARQRWRASRRSSHSPTTGSSSPRAASHRRQPSVTLEDPATSQQDQPAAHPMAPTNPAATAIKSKLPSACLAIPVGFPSERGHIALKEAGYGRDVGQTRLAAGPPSRQNTCDLYWCVQPDSLKSEHLPWSAIPKAPEVRSDPVAGNRG